MDDDRTTTHHIRPSSRGGGGRNNLVHLPKEWHERWHHLFENMTVCEVHEFIDLIMVPDVEWTPKQIKSLQLRLINR